MSSLVKNYKITDGGYKNNADTVYGELKDGTYFAYYPEMDLVEVYDCPVDELIDILYYNTTHEDELSEEEYSKISNKTFVTGTPTTVAFKEGVTQSKKLVGSKDEQSVVDFLVRYNYLEENK